MGLGKWNLVYEFVISTIWAYYFESTSGKRFSGFFHTNCMVVAPVNVASLRHYKNGLCFSVDDVYLKQEK